MAVREFEADHVNSTVPQGPLPLIPHTETGIDADHRYAVLFLEDQEVILQNLSGQTPSLSARLEYRLKNVYGKCYQSIRKRPYDPSSV